MLPVGSMVAGYRIERVIGPAEWARYIWHEPLEFVTLCLEFVWR